MSAATAKRTRGDHGPHLLSARTQRRAIRALRDRALTGDPVAVAMVLKLAGSLPDEFGDLVRIGDGAAPAQG
jgi:hypothetical protein